MRTLLIILLLIVIQIGLYSQKLDWKNGLIYRANTNELFTGQWVEYGANNYYFKIKIKDGKPQGTFVKELERNSLKGTFNWKKKTLFYTETDKIPEKKRRGDKIKISYYSKKTKYTPPIEDYPLIFEHSQLVQKSKLPEYGKDTISILENDLNYFDKVDVNKLIANRLRTGIKDAYYIVFFRECKVPAMEGRIKDGLKEGKWKIYDYCSYSLDKELYYRKGELQEK
ncbi:MAG: hypothetical protein GY810_16850 [Aureispira sp.]|nr:hypothetical protein [Aureispira sp.]